MRMTFAGLQIKGQRDYQEDKFQILENVRLPGEQSGLLLLLCDGMGGHAGGDVASKLVCSIFRDTFEKSTAPVVERLSCALESAQSSLADHGQAHPELQEMGTTLIAVCVVENELYWISVGDSPLWLVRHSKLKRLNADHSMMPILMKMVELGDLTADEARSDSNRHALRSVINSEKTQIIDAPEEPITLQAGDQIVLASDGVETLSIEAICDVLTTLENRDCTQKVSELLAEVTAVEKPNQDNATVILLQISEMVQ